MAYICHLLHSVHAGFHVRHKTDSLEGMRTVDNLFMRNLPEWLMEKLQPLVLRYGVIRANCFYQHDSSMETHRTRQIVASIFYANVLNVDKEIIGQVNVNIANE